MTREEAIQFKERWRLVNEYTLIIMKTVANRDKDWIDISSLLQLHLDLDEKRIRYWTKEFADVLDRPEVFEKVDSLLKSPRRERPK